MPTGTQIPVAAAPVPSQAQRAAPAVALPANQPERPATKLVIPTLGVDAPVVVISLENGTWSVDRLTREVGHMQGTASPGDPSNVAIAGHVTLAQGGDGPFRDLSQLKQGDEVLVYVGEQSYRYAITQVRLAAPEDVQVTLPTAEPTLTLITCANWNQERRAYDDRIVAQARLAP
jgi:sortase A